MLVRAGFTLLVPRQGKLDNDVTEHLADNGHLLLAPEVVLRKIRVKVRAGDTLARLASRHGVSSANVADWNKLRPYTRLKSGQHLAIYVPSKVASKSTKASRTAKRAGPKKRSTPAKRAQAKSSKR
jgi:membrane-bound lytic murein transglycosylase D